MYAGLLYAVEAMKEKPMKGGLDGGAAYIEPVCPRRDKWFRCCKFEPRYDEPEYDAKHIKNISDDVFFSDVPRAIATMRPKTYIHDVCVTCGKTVKRDG